MSLNSLIYHTWPDNQGYIKNPFRKEKKETVKLWRKFPLFFFLSTENVWEKQRCKGKNLEPEDPNFPLILNLAQPLAHRADDSLHFLELKSFLLQNLLKKDVSVN